MARTDFLHWGRLWGQLNSAGDPVPWYHRLIAAYAESHRHYHNLQHLQECLTEFDAVGSRTKQPACVEMALWFHDAVYDSHSTANEEASAELATGCLVAAHVGVQIIESVQQLIMCTKTHEALRVPDGELLVDIDLGILGQPSQRFRAYEHGIRAEYSWVPEVTYVQKRTGILAGFLNRTAIYRTEHFTKKYETAARINLQTAISRLQAAGS